MDWKLGTLLNSELKKNTPPKTAAEVAALCGLKEADVPGCLELELIKEGKLPRDLYRGTNVLEAQKLEATHLWYCTEFSFEKRAGESACLLFEGIDTIAEIFIDGEFFAFCENMLIPHGFSLEPFAEGNHELVVHIIPPVVYARRYDLPAACRAQRYNADSLMMRKAPYMFGWDIMPRIVSGGLWKDVKIVYKKKERIDRCNFLMGKLKDNKATFFFHIRIQSEEDLLTDFMLRVEGRCGDSSFCKEHPVFSIHERVAFKLEDPKLWWPKNYGEPHLYDVTVTLLKKGAVVDQKMMRVGLRTVALDRTDYAGPDGKFRFIINGKPVYALGTNWVPTSPFPSEHHLYTRRALEMLEDLGCNMLRLWGGNIYPEDGLYDFCDEHGIMLWQDFSMGCGYYPWTQKLQDDLRQEATFVVRRLGNHPSIVLWAGDNECDYLSVEPDENLLTRKVLKEVVLQEDGTRPYLPSSPYISGKKEPGRRPAEDHLWGPRDYFKGEFYGKSISHFVSETGYHGCPSPESVKKFIDAERLTAWGDEQYCADPQWQIHASSPAADELSPYVYRIPIMLRQIKRLFDCEVGELETYALLSQISQAEAVKFFIERFRIRKWYCGGMLWWNLIDGWPQFSDAIVDWYGCKKLAYHYIKRSQSPFALVCDEPDEEGNLHLVACNDARERAKITYKVKNALTGALIAEGCATVEPDVSIKIGAFPEKKGYYLIEWEGNFSGINHFVGKIGDGLDQKEYIQFMKNAGLYEKLEGF